MPGDKNKPLPPGSMIGIIGGGQLGRMLSNAASRLGFHCHVYDPYVSGPAAEVSKLETNGDYDDLKCIQGFVKTCDIITYEFENVPASTAVNVEKIKPLYPGSFPLQVSQDRYIEKKFIRNNANVPVAEFEKVNSLDDLKKAIKKIGLPAVLKTRRFGYDGKGQFIIKSHNEVLAAWESMKNNPAILEQFINFNREVSVVAARSKSGETAAYPLIENIHKNHILHTSIAPTDTDNQTAQNIALKILNSLNYVGVMAVEFFEQKNGDLIVNEIAPRVHNSGHWTQNAGCVDQFELHIRAIAGWPLGDTCPKNKVKMTNLIGDDFKDLNEFCKNSKTFIHLYGKKIVKQGRKMGHINQILDS